MDLHATTTDPADGGHGHDGGHEQDGGRSRAERRLDRRRAIGVLGGAGAGLLLASCGSGSGGRDAGTVRSSTSTTGTATSTTAAAASCSEIPEETAGPYPGDGSNGPDVLGRSGVVRSDIRSSFGSASGTATGVPLVIRFEVLEISAGCTPYSGAAVYVWHADGQGRYSMYSSGVTDQNHLRGVQAAGDDGVVEFTSIFPGCYDGRWPHIHFEVYPSLEAATDVSNKIATSQIALPQEVCAQVYATSGYADSADNLDRVSLASDMVFRDGWSRELGTVTGTPDGGDLTVTLTVPV